MNQKKSLIKINISVLLFSLAGLFAKGIHLPAVTITFARVLFSSFSLLMFCLFSKQNIKINNTKHLLILIASGCILAIHWWSFLYSIQISSVAIGTITFSSFPLFITILEPIFFHEKIHAQDIIFCLMILFGVLLTIPSFSLENRAFQGIIIGLLSALSYTLLTLTNRYFSNIYASITISLYEQATAAFVLLPTLVLLKNLPTVYEISALLFLGIITTAFAHTLFISSLKYVPGHVAGIISSMETVYGICFAMILFHEIPTIRESMGAFIIISTVVIAQLYENRL